MVDANAFPALSNGERRQERAKGFGFPMDATSWSIRHAVEKGSLPFKQILPNSVKIKVISIELRWQGHGGKAETNRKSPAGKSLDVSNSVGVEPTRQRRWFRLPPKVREVAGILGRRPDVGTRGDDQDMGERENEGDPESGHLSSSPTSRPLKPIPADQSPPRKP